MSEENQSVAEKMYGSGEQDAQVGSGNDGGDQQNADQGKDAQAAVADTDAVKDADAPKDADAAKDADPAKDHDAPKVPESYTFEGDGISETLSGSVTDLAKKLGLDNEKANILMKTIRDADAQNTESLEQQVKEQKAKWQADIKADKEFGGEKFSGSSVAASNALDKFGDPDFIKQLQESGYGEHPGLWKFLVRVGNAMNEDSEIIQDNIGQRSTKRLADRMYQST